MSILMCNVSSQDSGSHGRSAASRPSPANLRVHGRQPMHGERMRSTVDAKVDSSISTPGLAMASHGHPPQVAVPLRRHCVIIRHI